MACCIVILGIGLVAAAAAWPLGLPGKILGYWKRSYPRRLN